MNWETSEFTKIIRVSEEDYLYILATKNKKSIAGRLKEIIEYYKYENNNSTTRENR